MPVRRRRGSSSSSSSRRRSGLGRRALNKSFGGKTGVWWRADDDGDDDDDDHNDEVDDEVGGGEDVDGVCAANGCDVDGETTGTSETTANGVVEREGRRGGEAVASDGDIDTTDATSPDNLDDDYAEEEDEEQQQEQENDDDDDRLQQQQQQRQNQSTRKSCWDDVQMGWDDDLCRPIYYYRGSQNSSSSSSGSASVHGSGSGEEDDDDDDDGEDIDDEDIGEDDGDDGEDVSLDPPSSPSSLETPGGNSKDSDSDEEEEEEEDLSVEEEEEETMPAMKKRRRNRHTFGRQSNKRRAIASLIVMDHEVEGEEDVEGDVSTSSSSPGSEPTTTTLSREEADGLQKQNGKLQAARRISTSPLSSQLTNGEALDDANIEASAFDFIAEDSIDVPSSSVSKATQSRKGKKNAVNRVLVTTRKNGLKSSSSSSHDAPNPRSSLDDARHYFAKLDETHSLTLDNSETPVVSSRITRTIRGVDLTSPGLHVDYETYVEATVDSGVAPLPIEHFASSRRMNFRRRGDLFDGFLDVDVAGNS